MEKSSQISQAATTPFSFAIAFLVHDYDRLSLHLARISQINQFWELIQFMKEVGLDLDPMFGYQFQYVLCCWSVAD